MSGAHTPGPWLISEDCIHSTNKEAGDGNLVAFSPSAKDFPLSAEKWDGNAARIVACVNACEGMEDPVAEIARHKAFWFPKAVEERDELASELRALIRSYVSMMETARDRIIGCGGQCDDIETMEAGDPALIRAKAALAKVQP